MNKPMHHKQMWFCNNHNVWSCRFLGDRSWVAAVLQYLLQPRLVSTAAKQLNEWVTPQVRGFYQVSMALLLHINTNLDKCVAGQQTEEVEGVQYPCCGNRVSQNQGITGIILKSAKIRKNLPNLNLEESWSQEYEVKSPWPPMCHPWGLQLPRSQLPPQIPRLEESHAGREENQWNLSEATNGRRARCCAYGEWLMTGKIDDGSG